MAKALKVETPLLRVSRPVSACRRCRNAKVKCDGKLPACTACERAGRSTECSSANDQFARGKERSYVASLENRIEKLQRQIAEAKAPRATENKLELVSAQSFLTPPVFRGGSRIRRRDAQDVNDLVSDFGFLSLNATARDFHGFTRQMSFARLVLSTSSGDEMPSFAVNVLPQRQAITPLIQRYLDNIHILYPFLSETKLFAAVAAVYQKDDRYAASPMDHWTTRMVLAIALALWSRRRGDTQYQDAVRHAAGAFEHIEEVVKPGSLAGIQAMLLMVIYSMLDPHHLKTWNLIGLASRAMIDIGLHQDPPTDSGPKESDHEISRRVYASVYSLDRSISMVYLRGFSFTDDSASVTSSIRLVRPNSHKQLFLHDLDAAVQVERLRQIQSVSYQRIFQSYRSALEDTWPLMSRALSDMHQWTKDLPDHIQKPHRKIFLSDVLYSSILILSPPYLVGKLCDYGKFLIFEYAAEYAESMVSISGDQEHFTSLTYHDKLRASFVAQRLVCALLSDSTLLFGGRVPKAPPNSTPPSGPSTIPARTVGEMVHKAHRCLDQLERTLELLGPKYGNAESLSEFKAQSSEMRHTLKAIYDSWSRSLGVS